MFPKKFFNQIKLDHFFKKVGPGHRLDEQRSNQSTSSSRPEAATSSRTESEETRRAADAAIARYQQNKKGNYLPIFYLSFFKKFFTIKISCLSTVTKYKSGRKL